MLPAAVPSARIYTYDWNAKVFDNAPVQTLLGHADYLLGLVAAERGTSSDRPIIFIASCFGGLVLAEVSYIVMSRMHKATANLGRPSVGQPRRAANTAKYFGPPSASSS
ncbi:hypothetical protein F5Y02DRAFT_406037 [Annulohypoxylon stygium]|nr:hypothetical protein F5Y02DRAFT_406037 [Annulohypoxylon stygium]